MHTIKINIVVHHSAQKDSIMIKLLKSIAFTFLVIPFLLSYCFAQIPSPPKQPSTGPGGSDYKHGGIITKGPYWADGLGTENENNKYYVCIPDDPMPEKAPVVLFLHGWAAISLTQYNIWISHIVRQGYIVVWVQYQSDRVTETPKLSLPTGFTRKITVLWRDALTRLDSGNLQILPEKNELGVIKSAIVGHSAGAYLSAVIAAKSLKIHKRIPAPYAVVAVEPGPWGLIPGAAFYLIKSDTKFVVVVGDEDTLNCKSSAIYLWNSVPQIPDENKDFLLVQSDYHGFPQQISNHFFPNNSGFRDTTAVDARDFYITFKLSVGALNCAFKGTDCEYALGNGSNEQIYMGEWSDGEPVKPMVWIEDPNLLETTCEDFFSW